MWKDFFYYSKGERRAVYVLSLLIVFFAVGSFVLPQLKEKSKTSTVMDQEDSFSENIQKNTRKNTNKEDILVNHQMEHLKNNMTLIR